LSRFINKVIQPNQYKVMKKPAYKEYCIYYISMSSKDNTKDIVVLVVCKTRVANNSRRDLDKMHHDSLPQTAGNKKRENVSLYKEERLNRIQVLTCHHNLT
jgi:hypothetical protein